MSIFYKEKIVRGDCVVKKYRFLGFTFLRKEKTLTKQKYNLLGVKLCLRLIDRLQKAQSYDFLEKDFDFVGKISKKIDIIIPIYNGYEYLNKLFESIRNNTDLPYRLLIVNDCSTDVRVSSFLEGQKKILGNNIIIKNNLRNLGFLKSVNELLKISVNDVVLINTDVVLPQNWASRLFYPIFSDVDVASVTPFSNAATIFSLPGMCVDNKFSDDLEKVNTALKCFAPNFAKLKFATGVGFCMAMSQKAIKTVGLFDEVFGKGYGEENDWCQKACQAGFYNTVAVNLFVWHKHGGSFPSEEKKKLIKAHSKLLRKRYPNYNSDVKENIKNPYYEYVHFIAELLYVNALAEATVVWFDHAWGGGAEVYTKNIFEKSADKNLFLRVQQSKSDEMIVSFLYKDYKGQSIVRGMKQLKQLLSHLNIEKIVVNNLASYKNIGNTLLDIADIKERSGAFVSFRLHDFQCICPTITMMNRENKYCNESQYDKCKECVLHNPNVLIPCEDISSYQFLWRRFLINVTDEVVVFSKSSKSILDKFIPEISSKIKIVPHFIKGLRKVKVKDHKEINIGVIGGIGLCKGSELVNAMADYLEKIEGVNICVIGKLYPRRNKAIRVLGEYERDNLPQLLEDNNVDIVFIPSLWPETFSYTTREAIEMKIPVCCYNLGGQADQVRKYEYGLILEDFDVQKNVQNICDFVDKLKNKSVLGKFIN